jgi:DNA-directed RNA polymerase subunit beta
MSNISVRPQKFFSRFKKPIVSTPNFVEPQLESFKWLIEKGLKEVFEEFSSIKDFLKRNLP